MPKSEVSNPHQNLFGTLKESTNLDNLEADIGVCPGFGLRPLLDSSTPGGRLGTRPEPKSTPGGIGREPETTDVGIKVFFILPRPGANLGSFLVFVYFLSLAVP